MRRRSGLTYRGLVLIKFTKWQSFSAIKPSSLRHHGLSLQSRVPIVGMLGPSVSLVL